MKKILSALLCLAMLFSMSVPVLADGNPNIDGGGGMGQGTSQNSWSPGRGGVRVTIIRDSYKILLEPIAYFKYSGVMFAMTATEAALYADLWGPLAELLETLAAVVKL